MKKKENEKENYLYSYNNMKKNEIFYSIYFNTLIIAISRVIFCQSKSCACDFSTQINNDVMYCVTFSLDYNVRSMIIFTEYCSVDIIYVYRARLNEMYKRAQGLLMKK